MLTITRALRRAIRTHHGSRRLPLVLALSALLAVGTVVAIPTKAYAVAPEVRTALHAGVDDSGPFAVFNPGSGSVFNVVFGTHRSTDTGTTWTSDPTLSGVTWQMAVNGTLVGYKSSPSLVAVVYTVATGAQTTYPLPAQPASMNGTWSIPSNGSYAYNFLTGALIPVSLPTGATVSSPTAELTQSGAILWRGNLGTPHPAFAVSATPSSSATWVTIDGASGAVASDTQLVYVLGTTSAVQLCSRQLTALSGIATCSTVMHGTFDTVFADFSNFKDWTLVNIWTALGSVGQYTPYIWNGSLSTATKITLPAGSSIDQPTSAGADTYGTIPYALIRDSNTVPTIQRVLADGSLAAGFPLPPVASSSVGHLAVATDRVVGADTRDGSIALPTWTRTVSQSGFGPETVLPIRSSGLGASAARTVVSGPAGLSVYDRGTLRNTIADARLSQLSGPYLTRVGWNAVAQGPEVEVATVNNTSVGKFLGTAGSLFGSEYVTWTRDALDTGSAHVVINDLTGLSPARTVDLPAGTAICAGGRVWGDMLVMSCGSSKLEAFDLKTGSLVTSLSAPSSQFVNLTDVGDGYAIVTFNNVDYSLWNIALGSITPLTDCTFDATSDGVGHVACSSSTELIWRDFSSVSTSAPRLLGALASPTADFSNAGTWSVDFDATKPLKAGTVEITKAGGTGPVLRSLPTPASADGSIRGVSWDGLDTGGNPLQAGAYTYTLKADAVDGSGTVISSLSSAGVSLPATGRVTITSANPAGMSPGAFLSVSPSRLLDTRTTGGPIGSSQTRALKVTGVGGVPSTNVSAVVLNVTVTETTWGGYLTVSPTGSTRPVVSNLNWSAGATIPNAVTVKVGTGGSIDLYQSGPGTAQVIVDVAGYYVGGTVADPGGFTSITPARLLDTRTAGGGGKILANTTRDLQILGQGGVPATNASAVVLNVTATETTSGGYLSVFPSGTTKPVASNLNWSAGATIPNLVTVKVGTNGKVSLYQSGPGTAQVIVDVAGYYQGGTPAKPGMFVALTPARVLDTRTANPVAANADLVLSILNKGGIPNLGVSAVVINSTVTETKAPGYLTVYPGTNPLPTASNLNWGGAGATIPNLVTVQVGTDGTIKFHNGSGGTTQVIADTAGYYIGT